MRGDPRGGAEEGPVGVLGAAGPPLRWRPLAVRPRVVPRRPTRVRALRPGPPGPLAAARGRPLPPRLL